MHQSPGHSSMSPNMEDLTGVDGPEPLHSSVASDASTTSSEGSFELVGNHMDPIMETLTGLDGPKPLLSPASNASTSDASDAQNHHAPDIEELASLDGPKPLLGPASDTSTTSPEDSFDLVGNPAFYQMLEADYSTDEYSTEDDEPNSPTPSQKVEEQRVWNNASKRLKGFETSAEGQQWAENHHDWIRPGKDDEMFDGSTSAVDGLDFIFPSHHLGVFDAYSRRETSEPESHTDGSVTDYLSESEDSTTEDVDQDAVPSLASYFIPRDTLQEDRLPSENEWPDTPSHSSIASSKNSCNGDESDHEDQAAQKLDEAGDDKATPSHPPVVPPLILSIEDNVFQHEDAHVDLFSRVTETDASDAGKLIRQPIQRRSFSRGQWTATLPPIEEAPSWKSETDSVHSLSIEDEVDPTEEGLNGYMPILAHGSHAALSPRRVDDAIGDVAQEPVSIPLAVSIRRPSRCRDQSTQHKTVQKSVVPYNQSTSTQTTQSENLQVYRISEYHSTGTQTTEVNITHGPRLSQNRSVAVMADLFDHDLIVARDKLLKDTTDLARELAVVVKFQDVQLRRLEATIPRAASRFGAIKRILEDIGLVSLIILVSGADALWDQHNRGFATCQELQAVLPSEMLKSKLKLPLTSFLGVYLALGIGAYLLVLVGCGSLNRRSREARSRWCSFALEFVILNVCCVQAVLVGVDLPTLWYCSMYDQHQYY